MFLVFEKFLAIKKHPSKMDECDVNYPFIQ